MIENLFSFTQQEFLFAIVYGIVMIAGIYFSHKRKIQPILTLLLILSSTIIYLIISNILQLSIQQYSLEEGVSSGSVILIGIFSVLVFIRPLQKLFRIPTTVIHNLLIILLVFFSFFKVNEFLNSNPYFSFFILNVPVTDGIGSLSISTIQLSASLIPELINKNMIFIELLIAIFVTVTYVYFTAKLSFPGNRLLFSILMLMVLFFISLFTVNPRELPVFSDRLIGLNVVQWGLVLTGVLLAAYIMSKEMYTSRRIKEVLKRAPSEYQLLLFFLILTIISFQALSIFSNFEIKILLNGYLISTIFMVSYFLRRVEKYYLRYGTVSIILLTCILFIHANLVQSDQNEMHEFNIETPQILNDHSFIIDKDNIQSKSNFTETASLVMDDLKDSNYLISSSSQISTFGDLMIDRILETSP